MTTQRDFKGVPREQDPELLHGEDYDGSDPDIHRAIEKAFRRAYMQAASATVAAITVGASLPALHYWAHSTLWHWRNRAPLDRAVLPPRPPMPVDGGRA